MAFELIFQAPRIQQIEFKNGLILERLFNAFAENYVTGHARGRRQLKILPRTLAAWLEREESEAGRARLLCDYIAGMTDIFAVRTYRLLFDPTFGSITELA